MIYKFNRQKAIGFTLIELIIVLSIMVTMLGFVAPFTLDRIKSIQTKTELSLLKKSLIEISLISFVKQKGAQILLQAKEVNVNFISEQQELIKHIEFKHLFFEEQRLTFNKNGFISPSVIQITIENKQLEVDLGSLINE